MSAFTKLLAGAAPLPAEYRGVVVAKPLEALPIGGLGAGPPPHPLHWAETLRPIGATTPLVLTAKQAAGVRELNLSERCVEAIPPGALAPFPQLEVLHVAGNRLASLANVGCCWRLRRLFAARNRVSTLAPESGCELAALRFLAELDLSHNPLAHLGAVLDVLERLRELRTLSLAGCPCANEAGYRARVLARLPFLEVLDARPVRSGEARAAGFAHGGEAAGAVRLAALRASGREALAATRTAREAAATARGGGGPGAAAAGPLRSDGLVDWGNETGRCGLGRGGDPPPPPGVVFGGGDRVVTTTRAALRAAAAAARAAWDAEAAAAGAAAVAGGAGEAGGVGWHAVISHAAPAATAPPHHPTPAPVSALANMTQARFCEDIIARRVRRGMEARGVDAALLREGDARRAGAIASGELQSAFLTALAPALPALTGSAPLLPSGSRVEDAERGGGGAAAAAAAAPAFTLSAALSAGGSLRVTHGALAASLAAAASGAGVSADSHDHATLHRRALEASGTRLTRRVPPAAALARAGLSPDGARATSPAARARVAVALGREPPPRGGGGGGAAAASPTRVPTIDRASGALGEWDRYRLLGIFKRADRDGSGELSLDEIKACISECADYGFCVTLDGGGEAGEEEAGGGGAAGGGERPASASSRAPTPAGLAASTALLGTTSAAGRAAVLGAQKRLQALLEAIFEAVDTNRSGTISWTEFSQALEDGSRGSGGAPAAAGGAGAESAAAPVAPAAAHVPRMRFRPLTSEECAARANRHFRVAREKYEALQAALRKLPPARSPGGAADAAAEAAAAAAHAAWVKETSARSSLEAAAAAEKGVRLAALARALGGRYDPPEAPPSPPPPRADALPLFRVAPATEAAAAGGRGMRGAYRMPPPGAELTHEDAHTLAVLHPTVLQEEEEAEDALAGGEKGAQRAASAAAVTKTLGVDAWERHRLASKARAPHVVHRTTVHLTSPQAGKGPL
jgi:hypothetical protein